MGYTETYIDPSIAADSGTGTIGDPYGDIQYALNTMTRDGTNGDRLNVKAGTDEVLANSLSLATYGTPVPGAPLVFQGYTSVAGDGGIGGISGNGTYTLFADSTLDFLVFIDMHLHNSGASNNIINLDLGCQFENCEIDNTGQTGLSLGWSCKIRSCYFHNIGAIGVLTGQHCYIEHNYFTNGTNDFSNAISANRGNVVQHNVINIDGASNGIQAGNQDVVCRNNTIYSSAGTGTGVTVSAQDHIEISNNYIEGFSGAGGIAISVGDFELGILRGNRYYNNTTHVSLGGSPPLVNEDNSAVGSSALTNPGSGDFSVGESLKAGAWPGIIPGINQPQYLDIGAVQREELGGGGLPVFGGVIVR